mmetsp:Transcript_8754/g.18672  ORF Transcript_8754/g.18672 Transcript_8754/m.18672 type:complete len:391 (-) Transcript_8754:207-1379(-)
MGPLVGMITLLLAACIQPLEGQNVQLVSSLGSLARAVTEGDIDSIIRQNLEPDLKPWKVAGPLSSLSLLNLLHSIHTTWPEYRRNFVAFVVIKSGSIRWWAYPTARRWCTSRVEYMKQELLSFARNTSTTLPDVAFVMNGYDKPLCPKGNCSAPIFTFNKPWNTSEGSSTYDDVLFPVLNHPFDHLVYYPWDAKRNKALMRAGIYAAMAHDCQRVRLYQLAQTPAAKEWLDVGIYKNRHWRVKLKTVPPVPMEDHARWRYLLSADGQGASWRLAKLLAINSVVLKYRSDSIEYYYRSLHEGVHYISVDEHTLLQVLPDIHGQQERLQRIAQQAQEFAFKYLSQASRCAYATAALSHYKRMFSDMDKLLDALPQELSVEALMQLRSNWSKH